MAKYCWMFAKNEWVISKGNLYFSFWVRKKLRRHSSCPRWGCRYGVLFWVGTCSAREGYCYLYLGISSFFEICYWLISWMWFNSTRYPPCPSALIPRRSSSLASTGCDPVIPVVGESIPLARYRSGCIAWCCAACWWWTQAATLFYTPSRRSWLQMGCRWGRPFWRHSA